MAIVAAFGAVLVAGGGCAQVTGLDEQYTFVTIDAGADGGSDGGAAEDAATGPNATLDAQAPVDSGTTCNAQRVQQFVSNTQAPSSCRQCLPAPCCVELSGCVNVAACASYVSCHLDCARLSGGARSTCKQNCNDRAQASVRDQMDNALGQCAPSACKQSCGL